MGRNYGRFGGIVSFTQLDIENLVEEVRDLSKRDLDRLLNGLCLILNHLLKRDYQIHKRSRSWQNTMKLF